MNKIKRVEIMLTLGILFLLAVGQYTNEMNFVTLSQGYLFSILVSIPTLIAFLFLAEENRRDSE